MNGGREGGAFVVLVGKKEEVESDEIHFYYSYFWKWY